MISVPVTFMKNVGDSNIYDIYHYAYDMYKEIMMSLSKHIRLLIAFQAFYIK